MLRREVAFPGAGWVVGGCFLNGRGVQFFHCLFAFKVEWVGHGGLDEDVADVVLGQEPVRFSVVRGCYRCIFWAEWCGVWES